jgi:uncharacterized protein YbaR (Trm112 family)
MRFNEAMEEINNGHILACPEFPECRHILEVDEERRRMYCPEHGDCVLPDEEVANENHL